MTKKHSISRHNSVKLMLKPCSYFEMRYRPTGPLAILDIKSSLILVFACFIKPVLRTNLTSWQIDSGHQFRHIGLLSRDQMSRRSIGDFHRMRKAVFVIKYIVLIKR